MIDKIDDYDLIQSQCLIKGNEQLFRRLLLEKVNNINENATSKIIDSMTAGAQNLHDNEMVPAFGVMIDMSEKASSSDTKKDILRINSSSIPKPFVKEKYASQRQEIINEYVEQMLTVISQDEFEDGVVSKSEQYIRSVFSYDTRDDIVSALQKIFTVYHSKSEVLTGLLFMIGSIPYDQIEPEGPIMAMALLAPHRDVYLRDRGIQAFERWNCKRSLEMLRTLSFSEGWVQGYLEKVMYYIQIDGVD